MKMSSKSWLYSRYFLELDSDKSVLRLFAFDFVMDVNLCVFFGRFLQL